MTADGTNLNARLAAADPARALTFSDTFRAELWSNVQARRSASQSGRSILRWSRQRVLAVALPLLVVLGGGVAAATGVIRIGSPVTVPASPGAPPAWERPAAWKPGEVRILPLSVADPQGGPDWGMRVVAFHGDGAIQVGRVLDGKFGAYGVDGAFNNDGEFHVEPADKQFIGTSSGGNTAGLTTVTATPLDRAGQMFFNVVSATVFASAAPVATGQCWVAREFAPSYLKSLVVLHHIRVCPNSSLRTVIFGLLGPDAVSITYSLDGHTRTQPTVGPYGAYLMVLPGSYSDPEFPDGPVWQGQLPAHTPISEITYRGGIVCHLNGAEHEAPSASCLPHGEPVGYVK
jgi:hypothetical protein